MKHLSILLLIISPLLAFAEPDAKVILPAEGKKPAPSLSPLVIVEGTDLPFEELLRNGTIKAGERFFKGKVPGSTVRVDHALLEKQVGKFGPIPQGIGIHTQASGGISRKDFPHWTRWYQEDGNVQIMRLFKGEQNVRSGSGAEGSPGRIEAYSKSIKVAPGAWHEWEGTYTLIKPVGGCIFQLMHEGSLWPMHIDMSANGDIVFLRRRAAPGLERTLPIAQNMTGKSISIKVRANGTDFEVYQKNPLDAGPWKLVTKGSGPRAEDDQIQFRWGMYCGSKKGHTVPNDALILVTGVVVR